MTVLSWRDDRFDYGNQDVTIGKVYVNRGRYTQNNTITWIYRLSTEEIDLGGHRLVLQRQEPLTDAEVLAVAGAWSKSIVDIATSVGASSVTRRGAA